MKENAKFLKLSDQHKELDKKHMIMREMMGKMKEDREKLLDEYSKIDNNVGKGTYRSKIDEEDDEEDQDEDAKSK